MLSGAKKLFRHADSIPHKKGPVNLLNFVFTFSVGRAIILFLTVSKNKIAATPENIGVVAILTVVLNYSILFPSFTFFLDGFHLAFGDKFEICIKTTDLM